ncbi:hypothetical protein [Paractinoplanes globisporus]|uniref:Uncharacterized protein n=1 Tax=Paractinoplanes globisporus TaxID=113565 RepID=A0ABW6WLJ2_9ACTN|nr:hypothetical protein [Actinoplanes globisporus]
MTSLVLALLLAFAAVPAGGRPVEGGASAAVTAGGPVLTGGATVIDPRVPARKKKWIQWLASLTPGGGNGGNGTGGPGNNGNSWTLGDGAYSSFERGDCLLTLNLARLTADDDASVTPLAEPQRSLYEGAAAACLAAFYGRSDLWPVAASRFDRVRGTATTCRESAVLRILREIVTAHRADPKVRFVRGRGHLASCQDAGGGGGGWHVRRERSTPIAGADRLRRLSVGGQSMVRGRVLAACLSAAAAPAYGL